MHVFPATFIVILNALLVNEDCSFNFEDDSSIVVTSETTDDLTRKLDQFCAGVEIWYSTLRMVVNAGKTEIVLFNCEASDIKPPLLKGGPCQSKSHKKLLGMVIENQLTCRQHAEATAEKTIRNRNTIS